MEDWILRNYFNLRLRRIFRNLPIPGIGKGGKGLEMCVISTYKKSFVKIFKENGERVVEVFARVDNKRVIASVVMEKLASTLER